MPKVTVLMPVYNAEKYLREAIESILNQTFKDFEFLIIDDGSIDSSREIISSYNDSRIRFIAHEENRKLIATLNEGVELASASLIARMDADDISLPTRLEKQVRFMNENPEYVLLGTACEIIDTQGKKIGNSSSFHDDETLRLLLAFYTSFAHGSVMFRKESVLEAGGYSMEAYLVEDYDLWIRMARLGKIANLSEELFKYRSNPVGECEANKGRQREAMKSINEKYWNSFGNKGPAPLKLWKSKQKLKENQSADIKKRIYYLHIELAKKYMRYRKYINALFNLFLSFKICPKDFIHGAVSSGLRFLKLKEKKTPEGNDFRLGILVLFFEKVDQTIECIQSFLPSGMPIYILNNNSSIESAQKLKEFCKNYSNIKIFESKENLGPTGGRNFLIKNTDEEWLFFADNDIKIKTKSWLKILIRQIKKYPNIEAFIFRIYNLHDRTFNKPRPTIVRQGVVERGRLSMAKSLNIFPGGASCINRSLFERIGLYDEKVFVFEEMEMSLRALTKKTPIKGRLVNNILLLHDHRVAKNEEDKTAANFRYNQKKSQLSAKYIEEKYKVSLDNHWRAWTKTQKKIIVDGFKIEKKPFLSRVLRKIKRILSV